MRPLLLLLLVPAAAQAQDIVVTGRGLELRADPAAATVTLDRTALERNAAARLESVLGEVAGLQQFRRSDARSANPTSQGLTLRGLGGNAASRAQLVLDGVPQADPFGGWVAFPAYATGRLGRVTVTRGGGAVTAGPGAVAGLVVLESAAPGDLAMLGSGLALGSRRSLDANAALALRRSDGFAVLAGQYARSDGFAPIVSEQRGPADRRAPYEQWSVAARGVIDLGGATEAQGNLMLFDDRRQRGTAFTNNRSQGADASVRLVGRGRWGWSALAWLQLRDFASSFAAVDAARARATQTLDQYATPATGLGAALQLQPPLGPQARLALGTDLRAVSGRTRERFAFVAGSATRLRRAGGRNLTHGAFADGTLDIDRVSLSVAARLDRWRIEEGQLLETLIGGGANSDTRFASRSGTEPTGRVGLAWRAAPLTLRAAAFRAWRLPTLNELYRPFRVGSDAVAANAGLAPERIDGIEAGLDLIPFRGATIAATLFDNRLKGAIANVAEGRGPGTFPGVGFVAANGVYRVRRNLDAIRSRGWEIDGRYVRGPLFATLSWSHTNARVEASRSAAALDGLRPAQVPRDIVAATLGWGEDERSLSVTLRHVARQFDDDQNNRSLAPATSLDLTAGWPLTPVLALDLRAENLFDERIEAAVTGTDTVEQATPRTLWLGLKLRLR